MLLISHGLYSRESEIVSLPVLSRTDRSQMGGTGMTGHATFSRFAFTKSSWVALVNGGSKDAQVKQRFSCGVAPCVGRSRCLEGTLSHDWCSPVID